MPYLDIAGKVAANLSCRTGHPYENLHQIAVMGIIETSRRYARVRGPFRPYIRTYVNCEVYHFLRDKGFLIKLPASWRELHARGSQADAVGYRRSQVPGKLGVTLAKWREMVEGCGQRVVAFEIEIGE
jgi:DNA-directed RNA polymerase specialized sigma subunit